MINSARAFLKLFEYNSGLIRVSSVCTVATVLAGAGVDVGAVAGAGVTAGAGAGAGAGGSGEYAP